MSKWLKISSPLPLQYLRPILHIRPGHHNHLHLPIPLTMKHPPDLPSPPLIRFISLKYRRHRIHNPPPTPFSPNPAGLHILLRSSSIRTINHRNTHSLFPCRDRAGVCCIGLANEYTYLQGTHYCCEDTSNSYVFDIRHKVCLEHAANVVFGHSNCLLSNTDRYSLDVFVILSSLPLVY